MKPTCQSPYLGVRLCGMLRMKFDTYTVVSKTTSPDDKILLPNWHKKPYRRKLSERRLMMQYRIRQGENTWRDSGRKYSKNFVPPIQCFQIRRNLNYYYYCACIERLSECIILNELVDYSTRRRFHFGQTI